jgi:16S rRNA processing protein RimM
VKQHFQFGYVSRAHGLGGEVVVRTHDPSSTVFDEIERVHVRRKDGREEVLEVEGVREASGGDVLVSLSGIESKQAADDLRGSVLSAFREDLEEPAAGEFFFGDLIGLRAQAPDGRALGTVEEVWSSGPVPNLVIREGKEELMVPFAEDFIVKVSVEDGVVVLNPPEYL